MRIAFLCKRQYMDKDVILDRYARLYEIPHQLARLGHSVKGYCLDYHSESDGEWSHEGAPGSLNWESRSLGSLKLPRLIAYPVQLLKRLRAFQPDVIIGASDIPHVALAARLSRQLGKPCVVDLYDNFEGFGQARIPGFVAALRWATRQAGLVTTTSEPLRQLVLEQYKAQGMVISMPSSVDLNIFNRNGEKSALRKQLGLPLEARLIGTAGGLYPDKGVEPIYRAWLYLAERHPDLHLILAGPYRPDYPPPNGERIHYLGSLPHAHIADLFRALDVGIISILDTPFGRYCFPQKAYEMLACGLPVAAAKVGAMTELFKETPQALFSPDNPGELAAAVLNQLNAPKAPQVPIKGWSELISEIEPCIKSLVNA